MEIKCLYQDERLVVCLKPPGIRSTDEPGGLLDLLRRQMDGENENTSLRTVHRLDQVAGGVMVIARSRVAAQLLSAQISDRNFQKEYLAVVEGTPASPEGEFRDLLARDRAKRRTYVTTHPGKGVREAVLRYRLVASREAFSLVRVQLLTGRTHQIRCQFAARELPLAGDLKYRAQARDMEGIALWSCLLSFDHPQTGQRMEFSAPPPQTWPWTLFPELWQPKDRGL